MARMSPELTAPACPALLVDGSSTSFYAGVLGKGWQWLAFKTADEPALESLFTVVEHVLQQADVRLEAIRSYVYCEGPGSVLGLRLCAMAIETWRRLQPMPGVTYGYNSLQLAAADLLQQRGYAEVALLISDWKKDAWNGLKLSAEDLAEVTSVTSGELADWSGPLYHLPARKGWQQPPANAVELSYQPQHLPDLLATPRLLRITDGVTLYQSGLNTFRKWTPDRHRA